MSIKCLNLCLSNRCNASCIWCPTSRGTKHNFDMPFETVKKIIDELSDPSFPTKIKMIHVSENGEALYNKDFLDILRYIKQKLPDTAVSLLSNFGLMTYKISKTLLKEKLLSSVQVNIDGHDEASYKAVKGISYGTVIRHLKSFINLRKEYDPEFHLQVNVMPAFTYYVTVKSLFKAEPDRAKDPIPYSDFNLATESLRKFLPDNVRIHQSSSGLWAERKLMKINPPEVNMSDLDCPLMERVETEAFIAPNGDWYPCCLDDNQDIVLGNVNENTILEIFNSATRQTFLSNLKARRYEEIGYPCNTVVCCQTLKVPDDQFKEWTKGWTKGSVIHIAQAQ